MTNLEDARVVIELTSVHPHFEKVQIVLADNGSAQIVFVETGGERRFNPDRRFDHASALTSAGAILTGARGGVVDGDTKILAAALLLLNQQLEETHALLRVARLAAQTMEPL